MSPLCAGKKHAASAWGTQSEHCCFCPKLATRSHPIGFGQTFSQANYALIITSFWVVYHGRHIELPHNLTWKLRPKEDVLA